MARTLILLLFTFPKPMVLRGPIGRYSMLEMEKLFFKPTLVNFWRVVTTVLQVLPILMEPLSMSTTGETLRGLNGPVRMLVTETLVCNPTLVAIWLVAMGVTVVLILTQVWFMLKAITMVAGPNGQ